MYYSQLSNQTDSSLDIKHPPTSFTLHNATTKASAGDSTYPLLGTSYQAPNFSTFGVEHKAGLVGREQQEYHHQVGGSVENMFGLGHAGDYDGLTRRMYQADSNHSLNAQQYAAVDFPPPPTNVVTQSPENLYAKVNKKTTANSQQPQNSIEVLTRSLGSSSNGNSSFRGSNLTHTAPIVPRRPAPAVPTRAHHTAPIIQQHKHCKQCTFANKSSATTCEMCQNPLS